MSTTSTTYDKVKCATMQDRRLLDLILWQNIIQPMQPSPSKRELLTALTTSMWNYLSTPHLALRPLELQQVYSLVKTSPTTLSDYFTSLC